MIEKNCRVEPPDLFERGSAHEQGCSMENRYDHIGIRCASSHPPPARKQNRASLETETTVSIQYGRVEGDGAGVGLGRSRELRQRIRIRHAVWVQEKKKLGGGILRRQVAGGSETNVCRQLDETGAMVGRDPTCQGNIIRCIVDQDRGHVRGKRAEHGRQHAGAFVAYGNDGDVVHERCPLSRSSAPKQNGCEVQMSASPSEPHQTRTVLDPQCVKVSTGRSMGVKAADSGLSIRFFDRISAADRSGTKALKSRFRSSALPLLTADFSDLTAQTATLCAGRNRSRLGVREPPRSHLHLLSKAAAGQSGCRSVRGGRGGEGRDPGRTQRGLVRAAWAFEPIRA